MQTLELLLETVLTSIDHVTVHITLSVQTQHGKESLFRICYHIRQMCFCLT